MVLSERKESKVEVKLMAEEIRVWNKRTEKRLTKIEGRSNLEVGGRTKDEQKGI